MRLQHLAMGGTPMVNGPCLVLSRETATANVSGRNALLSPFHGFVVLPFSSVGFSGLRPLYPRLHASAGFAANGTRSQQLMWKRQGLKRRRKTAGTPGFHDLLSTRRNKFHLIPPPHFFPKHQLLRSPAQRYGPPGESTARTVNARAPCAPITRDCSMSAVFEGPEMKHANVCLPTSRRA